MKDSYRIKDTEAHSLLTSILMGAGLNQDDAWTVADNLIMAELRGIPSHGMSRMEVYCERMASGAIDTHAKANILSDRGSTLTLDAQHGPGQVTGRKAMELTIERAKDRGICMTAVRNGSHFGIAAYYAMMVLEAGMVGVALTNAPPVMCPWGSRDIMLGTNPFAVAMPAGRCEDFVFDSASSVVARGKIILADKEGRSIPEG